METIKNVLVGQSGGPTAVINASLAGVYETARAMGAEHVYGLSLIHISSKSPQRLEITL